MGRSAVSRAEPARPCDPGRARGAPLCACPIRSASCWRASALAATRSHAGLALTHDLIFDVVLPPLLFEAALNLALERCATRSRSGPLRCRQSGSRYARRSWRADFCPGLGWPIEFALVFGALISATDPIAVVALIKELRVTGRLSLLIEAESLFNDGACGGPLHSSFSSGRPMIRRVRRTRSRSSRRSPLSRAAASLAGFGRRARLHVMIAGTSEDHLVETALTVVAAFGSFLIAEHFGASGVLATVAAGMTMGNLGVLTEKERFGLSITPHGRAFVLEFWEFAAFLANSLVFLLIGSALATIDFAREGLLALTLVYRARPPGPGGRRLSGLSGVSWGSRWAIPLNQAASDGWGGLRGALSPGAGARLACRLASA